MTGMLGGLDDGPGDPNQGRTSALATRLCDGRYAALAGL
jgi:hypothetical protein